MNENNALFAFSGAISRNTFLVRLFGLIFCGLVFSVGMGILNIRGDIPVVISSSLILIAGATYVMLLGMLTRRVRDIFGTPVLENFKSIALLIFASLPSVGFIAWIFLCLVPGKITEKSQADNFLKNSVGKSKETNSVANELTKVVELHNQGLLSEEEFVSAKKRLLS